MGFIYPRHLQAIAAAGGEVALTCDINPEKQPDFTDWLEMFHHPRFQKITHVTICTPNYLHAVIVREALFRGKQVLCEKPLSINGIYGLEGVKTVLQLRYHPMLQDRDRPKSLTVVAKMFRDQNYWSGWKGNKVTSGGILFNLGIHYLDLGVFMLGNVWKVVDADVTDKKVTARVVFGDSIADFHIEILDSREGQERYILADGAPITLSNHDNLSYEDLHQEVYRQFLSGNGVPISEAKKSLQLAHDILIFNEV